MARDDFGNYVVGVTPDPYTPGNSTSGGGLLHGVGPPDSSLGSNGQGYVNDSNGDFYTKSGDVWILFTGGGGAGGLAGVVDPEGVVSAAPGTPYVNSATHTFWMKETGTGNTGWLQYV